MAEVASDVNAGWLLSWQGNPDRKKGGQSYAAVHVDMSEAEWHLPPKKVIAVVGAFLGVNPETVGTDGKTARTKLEKAGIQIHDFSDRRYRPPASQLLLVEDDQLPKRVPLPVHVVSSSDGKGHGEHYRDVIEAAGCECVVHDQPLTVDQLAWTLRSGEAVLIYPTAPVRDGGRIGQTGRGRQSHVATTRDGAKHPMRQRLRAGTQVALGDSADRAAVDRLPGQAVRDLGLEDGVGASSQEEGCPLLDGFPNPGLSPERDGRRATLSLAAERMPPPAPRVPV